MICFGQQSVSKQDLSNALNVLVLLLDVVLPCQGDARRRIFTRYTLILVGWETRGADLGPACSLEPNSDNPPPEGEPPHQAQSRLVQPAARESEMNACGVLRQYVAFLWQQMTNAIKATASSGGDGTRASLHRYLNYTHSFYILCYLRFFFSQL